jgi:TP901 family phage tail tape measure protein
MSKSFNLTAELNLSGPANIKAIVGDIKRELGTVSTDIKLQIDKKSTSTIDSITTKLSTMNKVLSTSVSNTNNLNVSLSQLASSLGTIGTSGTKVSGSIKSVSDSAAASSKNIKAAASNMEEFGKQSFLAVKRFAAFTFATSGIVAFTAAVTKGLKAYVEFDQQIIRLRQVTGTGAIGVKILSDEITRLAQAFGVSSSSLAEVAVTLAQAGLSARETKVALEALAKSELAPSFDNIKDTTEGAIAALRQFNLETKDLEAVLGSINAVAAAFAVEASDIIAAIQRTGGVFASASKGVTQGTEALNEFIAIFTSVRATTRESAETIATGLRTIFTRIQRAKTIDLLRQLGVELQDVEGKFVGPFEAVRRLSEALNSLDPRDIRFSSIVEELGGFRQIGKVIPLLQQFETAQKALGVAQRGQSSLTDAQVIAQQSLANQLARVREQFLALIREVGQSNAFQGLFKIVTGLASGLISLVSAFKPIIPILAVIGAVKGGKALSEFGGGFFGSLSKAGSKQVGENLGSTIAGTKEKERAEATSKAADAIRDNTTALQNLTKSIEELNISIRSRSSGDSFSDGGKILGFNRGGVVPGSGKGDKVPAMLEPGEVVMNNRAASRYGRGNLVRMNKYASGGKTIKTIYQSDSGTPIKKYSLEDENIQDQDIVTGNIDRRKIGKQQIDSFYKNSLSSSRLQDSKGDFAQDMVSASLNRTRDDGSYIPFRFAKGFAFEDFINLYLESVEKEIGYKKTKGQYDPVDFIKAGYDPIEVRFRDKATTDGTAYAKLLRYQLESLGKPSDKLGFTKKLDLNPPANTGNLILYEIDPEYKKTIGLKYGGQIQKFVDGGWVERMKTQKTKKLEQEYELLESMLMLFEIGERKVPVNTFNTDGPRMEDIGKRETNQRMEAIYDHLLQKKLEAKKRFASRKGPGLQSTDQYDETEMLDAITLYQAGSGPFTRALASGKKKFKDRGATYQTTDIRDRLLSASQFNIPKKTYSGLGRGQLKEILNDTGVTPKALKSKPKETLQSLVGQTIDFPTFLSVSAAKSQAEAFVQNPGALLSIDGSSASQKTIDVVQAKAKADVPDDKIKSSRRLPGLEKINSSKTGFYDQEKEFIVPPNTPFQITKASGKVSSRLSRDLKNKKIVDSENLFELYFDEDDEDFEKTRLNLQAKMLRRGGLVQNFKNGSPDGVTEIDPFEQYGRIGGLAKEKIDKDKTLTIESALRKTLVEQLEGLGKEAGVRDLVSIPESFKRRLRRNLIEDGTLSIAPVASILNNALKASGTDDAARKAKEDKTRKVAIAGLFPIGYNKDFPDWKLDNGKEIYAYVRGFSSSYLDDVKALQQANSATRQKFAEDVQDTTALGLLGNKNVQGPVQPLAIDFDETLVRNTKMLDAEGEEDLPAYAIRDKVIASLADAKPTSLATRLANIEKENPGMVRQFTRILTARPQTTADIIASTLNRFGLPYLEQDITGVSRGLGTNIAKAKSADLAAFEKLIDDNEKTIREVRKSGKSAFQYGELADLSKTAEEKFGISNIEGGMLESALAQLLGYPIDIDKLERNRAIDFPQGLGRGAQIFGLPPNIETEVKRTLDGDSFTKAREEFSRYFTENPDKYAVGGRIQSFERGSPDGVKDRSTKNLVRGARGDNIVWKGMKVPLSYEDIMGLSTEDMIAYGRSQEFDDYVFSGGAGIATKKLIKLPDGLTQEEIEAFGSDIIKKADGYYSEIEEIYKFRKAKNLTSPASSMREARTLAAMEAEKGNRFYTQAEEAIASFKKSGILSPFDPSIDSHIQSSFPRYISSLESQLKTETDPDEKNSIQRKLKKAQAGWPDYQALLKGNPVPNQGRITGLSETLNSLLESYGSPVSSKEIDSIISALGSKLMKKNIGGIIQSFKKGGKPSRYVDWESGVGPSPFDEPSAPKLDYYSILKNSGLNLKSWMIDSLADRARTNRWTPEQIIAEASRSQASSQQNLSSTMDRESLLSSLGARPEVSEKQRKLAQSLIGPVDARYDPKYDNARRGFAIGGLAEDKKQKEFGKIALRSSRRIQATYIKDEKLARSGQVIADKIKSNLYAVQSSSVSKGYGPKLYDIVMEAATEDGSMLTSDRRTVSSDAMNVWKYYFNNRSDVKKTPLDPEDWVTNNRLLDPKLYGPPETWPSPTDPAWILQSGYSKSPSLINDASLVERLASGGKASKFSSGGTIPALVSNGEAYVPPETAQRIGYGTLNRMNQADRNGMGRFSRGSMDGVGVFRGPGTGTSDSIRTNLPVGSYILRQRATAALGLNRGGSVGVSKFSKGGGPEDDIDLGNKGRDIQEKQLILKSKEAKKEKLNKEVSSLTGEDFDNAIKEIESLEKEIADLTNQISRGEEEFKVLAQDIAAFSEDVENTGKDFNAAMKELRDRVADSLTKQAAAKGETVTDEDIDKATRQVAKTGKAKTAAGKIDFTTFDAGRKLVEKVQNAQESFSSSKNIKNNRQKEFKEKFGETTSFNDIEQSSASNFVSRAKSEIEEQTKRKEELQTKASGATGAEKAILQDQILKSENRIKELNDAIDGTTAAYLEASKAVDDQKTKVDEASQATKDAEENLNKAYQGIINALRKKIKNFDSLSIEEQTAAVKQVAETGKIISKSGKEITDPGLEAARREYAAAEWQAKVDMPDQETLAREKLTELQAVQEKLNPSSLSSTTPSDSSSNPKILAEEQNYMKMRAERAGLSVGGYKYSMAQKLGQNKFNVEREMSLAKQETKDVAAGRRRELKGVNITEATKEGATTEEAKRVQSIISDFTNQLQKADPTLGAQEARDAAIALAEGLSKGDKTVEEIVATNKTLNDTLNGTVDANKVLEEAFRRTSVEMGESIDNLRANISDKQIQQQAFIQSIEGQRFGNLAQFAPDTLQAFSQSKLGGRLASGADFISGKGGRFSKAFAGVGGIAGVGAGATLAADQLKNALKTYAPELSTNIEVAGALGALGGAGTGAASGAILGAQVAGPVGALVAGVGGAIIGGIQGYFNAKNQQILTNALEKIASTTGELDLAMKKLAQSADDVNFRSAQAAFGAVLDAGKDIRDMSQSSGFTSSDAGGVAAYAAGGAIAGAIAGSIVPILGTALGAALGGIAGAAYGVFNRPSEAQRKEALTASIGQASRSQDIASQLASSQLGRLDTESLGKIYDQLKDGTATVNPVVEQYVKGMLEAAKATEGADLSASRVEEITATAQANAALDSYMKSRKEAGATEEQIGRELKTDREQAIKIGQYYLDENAKLLVQQQMLAKATRDIADELANLGDVFKRISGFIDRFSAEMDELDSSIQNRIGDMTGKSEIKKSDRRFQRVLSNVGSYSPEDVEEAANFAINIGGGGEAAKAFGQTAIISRVFQNQLPQLIRESKDIEGITDEGDRKQTASNVTGELRRTLEDALKGTGELTVGAQKAINTIVGQAQKDLESGKGLDDQGNLTKFSSVLQEGANGVAKFVQKYYDILDQAIKYQEQYNQLMIQSGEVLRKSNSIRINAELELKKTLGGTLSLDELTSSFDTEIKSLTSGLVDGGTTDPQEIARRLQEKEEQKRVLQEAVSNKALEIAAPENAVNRDKLLAEQNDLIAQQRELSRSINEGSTALDRLANDGTKAAAALSKIQEGRQRSEAAGNLLEKIFTGSAADVNNMVINNAALQASQQDPSLLNSRATRQQAFAGLQQLQGILSPQDFNKAKADLLEGSLRASGVNLDEQTIAGKSFNDILADLRADPNQNDPMIKAYNDAINAQVKAGEMIADRLSQAAEQLKLPTKEEIEAGKFDPNSAIGEFINKVTAEYPTIVQRAYDAVIADLEAIKARAEEGRGEPPREREEQANNAPAGIQPPDETNSVVSTAAPIVAAAALTYFGPKLLKQLPQLLGGAGGVSSPATGSLDAFNKFFNAPVAKPASPGGGGPGLSMLFKGLALAEIARGGYVGATADTSTNRELTESEWLGENFGTALNTLTGALTGNTGQSQIVSAMGIDENSSYAAGALGNVVGSAEAAGRGAAIGYQFGGTFGALVGAIGGLAGDVTKNGALLVQAVGDVAYQTKQNASSEAKNREQAEKIRQNRAEQNNQRYSQETAQALNPLAFDEQMRAKDEAALRIRLKQARDINLAPGDDDETKLKTLGEDSSGFKTVDELIAFLEAKVVADAQFRSNITTKEAGFLARRQTRGADSPEFLAAVDALVKEQERSNQSAETTLTTPEDPRIDAVEQMANEATKPGSIYVHDINVEKILLEILKKMGVSTPEESQAQAITEAEIVVEKDVKDKISGTATALSPIAAIGSPLKTLQDIIPQDIKDNIFPISAIQSAVSNPLKSISEASSNPLKTIQGIATAPSDLLRNILLSKKNTSPSTTIEDIDSAETLEGESKLSNLTANGKSSFGLNIFDGVVKEILNQLTNKTTAEETNIGTNDNLSIWDKILNVLIDIKNKFDNAKIDSPKAYAAEADARASEKPQIATTSKPSIKSQPKDETLEADIKAFEEEKKIQEDKVAAARENRFSAQKAAGDANMAYLEEKDSYVEGEDRDGLQWMERGMIITKPGETSDQAKERLNKQKQARDARIEEKRRQKEIADQKLEEAKANEQSAIQSQQTFTQDNAAREQSLEQRTEEERKRSQLERDRKLVETGKFDVRDMFGAEAVMFGFSSSSSERSLQDQKLKQKVSEGQTLTPEEQKIYDENRGIEQKYYDDRMANARANVEQADRSTSLPTDVVSSPESQAKQSEKITPLQSVQTEAQVQTSPQTKTTGRLSREERKQAYVASRQAKKQAYLSSLNPKARARIEEKEARETKRTKERIEARASDLMRQEAFGSELTPSQRRIVQNSDAYREEQKIKELEQQNMEAAESNSQTNVGYGFSLDDINSGAFSDQILAERRAEYEAQQLSDQKQSENSQLVTTPTTIASPTTSGTLGTPTVNAATTPAIKAAETGQQVSQSQGPDGSLVYNLTIDDKSIKILESFNTGLENFATSFGDYVSRLENLEFNHKLEGEYNINVNFTGEAPLKALNETMKELAKDLVMPEIDKLREEIRGAGMDLRSRGSRG